MRNIPCADNNGSKPTSSSFSMSSSSSSSLGHDILRTVIDQLVSLSSMALVNIRVSVVEAALCINQSLLQGGCSELRQVVATAQRQMAAEEANRSSKALAVQNPKYQACLKQRNSAAKVITMII